MILLIQMGCLPFRSRPGDPDHVFVRHAITLLRSYSLTFLLSGVGVVNILKFLRLDLVRRITYLDHPDISKWAVLASVKFDF